MRRFIKSRPADQKGFTFVEIVVIAPIVILSIAAFIGVAVQLTGETLVSREQDTMVYSIQDAINRVDQDVKLSAKFLAQNSTPITSTTKQGYNNDGQSSSDATQFYNVDFGTPNKGNMLVLKALATSGNPLDDTTQFLYLANAPNACGDTQQTQNTPLFYNIIYYVKNDALWRRTVMPLSSTYTACAPVGQTGTGTPFQRASCARGFTNVNCRTEDELLVQGIAATGFTVGYYANATSTSANATASTSTTASTRQTALNATTSVRVSITGSKLVAGRTVSESSNIRSTRLPVMETFSSF